MSRSDRTTGLSLIELLVALTVGLVLLAGVARIFVNSRQAYRVQESTSRMQENIRIAVEQFSSHLRLADFWGGVKADRVTALGIPAYPGPGACENAWIVDPSSGVVGYAGGARAPVGLPAGCLSNYVPGSDVLAIRYVDPDSHVATARLTAASAINALRENGKYYLRSRIGDRGLLFDITSTEQRAAATAAGTGIPGNADDGVMNHQLQTVVFYLRNIDFGRGPVPTLNMLRLQSDGLKADQLVDGIEMLSFAYGIDSDGDGGVDGYREAGAVAVWPQVLAVRVAFIARGDEIDTFADTREYPISGDRCHGPVGSSCASKYPDSKARFQRRLVVKEIQLRNRLRG